MSKRGGGVMASMIDYILWRGDLSFEVAPFNEVDNLILSKLSYLNFNGIISEETRRGMPLHKVAEIYFKEGREKVKNTGDLMQENFFELLRLMAQCVRYKNVKLKMYVEQMDVEEEMQFAAVTIDIGNRTLYIAYRGTDDTLVGWKEDLKMSVMDMVPAQREALQYFNKVATRYRGYRLYVGGHSKGGNLAVFSAIHTEERFKRRIIQIYNNDGPGFKEALMDTPEYQSIAGRITTLVPQSSIIGMLLEHEEDYIVVRSNQKGILQHDGFSWEVCGTSFIHLKSVTAESQIVDLTFKRFLEGLTLKQREQFTNTLFDILSSNEKKTITDLKGESWKGIISMIKTYDQLDKETKKAVTDIIGLLLTEGIRSILEIRRPEQWKDKIEKQEKKGLSIKKNSTAYIGGKHKA